MGHRIYMPVDSYLEIPKLEWGAKKKPAKQPAFISESTRD
jgi:hypothetical protein